MKVLNAEERKKSFKEIESCFSEEQALSEANRCLQCSEPGCVKGCPAGVDCKGFILKIREKNFQGALQTILEEDSLPCFTCRGCNAEQQCEGACILAKKGFDVTGIDLAEKMIEAAKANMAKSRVKA